MTFDYDVVVVGARVAGASTAMLLARRGHRVLMVDRAAWPSDTVSTHGISRSGVLQLERWGVLDSVVAAGTPPIRDITLGFGTDRIPFAVRHEYGIDELYAPRRFLLDAVLADSATTSGADFESGVRMTGVLTDRNGTVTGVVLDRRGRETHVRAPFVIGADGAHSRLARLVDAPLQAYHPPTNTVHYAYYTGLDTPGFWFQFSPGVNAGFITTNDDAVCAFVGRPRARMKDWAADPESEFRSLMRQAGEDLAERVDAASRIGRFRGTTGLAGIIRQPWGAGWALVGDAGYTKDPISAHGISDALRDAELCARAIDTAIRFPDQGQQALREYARVRDVLSWPMFEESKELAAFGWDAGEASARMRVVSEMVRRECDVLISLPDWPEAQSAA